MATSFLFSIALSSYRRNCGQLTNCLLRSRRSMRSGYSVSYRYQSNPQILIRIPSIAFSDIFEMRSHMFDLRSMIKAASRFGINKTKIHHKASAQVCCKVHSKSSCPKLAQHLPICIFSMIVCTELSPNLTFERDAAKARRPSTLRWASAFQDFDCPLRVGSVNSSDR